MPAISSTPIHALNSDILLHVFAANANMFADRLALNTTCITSQVCRRWRDLLIDTPSMWAKLVDIDIVHRCAPEWWDELIRRGGAAPLWITVDSYLLSETHTQPDNKITPLEQFFAELIRRNWHRIQKLVVHGDYPGLNFGLSLSMLCFPAPQLEEFEAPLASETMRAGGLEGEVPTTPIFANHAPMLHRFRVRGYADIQQAAWLRHLSFLQLEGTYDIHSALEVLSATRSLQELKIDLCSAEDLSIPLPTVSLPHLKHLQYHGHPQPCFMFLDHINIPLTCSLTVGIFPVINYNVTQLLAAVDTFIRYAERYLQSHIFDIVRLNYASQYRVTFECESAPPVECLLSISIPLQGDHDPDLLAMFLNRLTRLNLSHFTKFLFRAKAPLNPCLGPFFSSFPSIDTISADSQTLGYLSELQAHMTAASANQPIFFPCLKLA